MDIKKYTSLLFSYALVACSTAPKAPSTDKLISDDYSLVKAYLENYIPRAMKKSNLVGLSVALIDDQRIVWSDGFGYADKSTKTKASAETLYRAGSVSKRFTATAAMQLAEAGKVDIDAPLMNYIPEFKLNSRFGSINAITLRNTLSHHAGIPSNIIDGMWAKNPESFKTVTTRLSDYYAAYAPNTVFAYSNAGYSLVGHAIENASGMAFADYMHYSILQPLGMSSSNFAMHTQDRLMSKAYWRGKETEELPLRDLPAGGLVTSVQDLAQFVKMVHAEGTVGAQILKPETLKEMIEVQRYETPYEIESRNTIGWINMPGTLDDKYFAVGHGGQTMLHSAWVMMVPELKLGVVLLSNSPSLAGELGKISEKIFEIAYPVKTGTDLNQRKKEKRESLAGNVDTFDGIYSSEAGLIQIVKKANGYDVRAGGHKFKLIPEQDGQHKLKLKLFGIIPIAPGELKNLRFEARASDGKKQIVVQSKGARQLVATEISTDDKDVVWDNRIGDYELTNPIDTKIDTFKINGAKIGYSNNVYYLEIQTTSLNPKMPLKIINDTEATLQGYGRGLGETILVKDDYSFAHEGWIFKRKR